MKKKFEQRIGYHCSIHFQSHQFLLAYAISSFITAGQLGSDTYIDKEKEKSTSGWRLLPWNPE